MTRHSIRPHASPLALAVSFISGWALLLALLLGFQFAWQYWGVGLDSTSVEKQLETTARQSYTTPGDKTGHLRAGTAPVPPSAADGQLLGYIRIPAMSDKRLPIIQGVNEHDLDYMGAGHYPNTAMAGQEGNASYAGHRAPAAFGYLDRVKAGDPIIIETTDTWYVYAATTTRLTTADHVEVIGPNAAGVSRGVTLTTCDPMWATTAVPGRLIVHGRFLGWMPKSEGLPPQLASARPGTATRLVRSVSTVSERVGMPVTGMLAVSLAAMWLLLETVLWLACHERMTGRRLTPTLDPLALLWRLQAGPLPESHGSWGSRILYALATLIRLTGMLLLLAAVMFAMWRWACPWLADTIPWLETPHPPTA